MTQMDIEEIREGFQRFQQIGLNSVLTDQHLAELLATARTHKEQPLLHVIRAAVDPMHNAGAVAANTDYAIRNIQARGDADLKAWLPEIVERACDTGNFENASGALGEIRAAGTLLMAGADAKRVVESPQQKTPDFRVNLPSGQELFVEVHTKNMTRAEADKLRRFNQGPPGTHVVRPAGGKPGDPSETTVENVASKFAQIKSKGLQTVPSKPGVLWLDLQDEDWWTLSARDAAPAWVGNDGSFFSSGLWHAFYGLKGTMLLEEQSVARRAVSVSYPMRFDGMFAQHRRWSGAVLSFRRDLLLFENPDPEVPLPPEFVELATSFFRFNYGDSWLDWPPGRASLTDRVSEARSHLAALAAVAKYTW